MTDEAKGRIKIKAAGGIRTLETIHAMEKPAVTVWHRSLFCFKAFYGPVLMIDPVSALLKIPFNNLSGIYSKKIPETL